MPNKRRFSTFNFGSPTDSDIEPEIIIRRGTRTRTRSPEYRSLIDFSTIVPTVQDLTAYAPEPEVIDLTASSPPAVIDLTTTMDDLTTLLPIVTTSTTHNFVNLLDLSDLSDSDSDTESVASTVILPPTRTAKHPIPSISITRPIRPHPIRSSYPLEDLPPVTSTHFYSTYDLSLQHMLLHEKKHFTFEFSEGCARPVWMHPDPPFVHWCNFTKFMHRLYLQCPFTRWRPVTREMGWEFYHALKFSGYSGFDQVVPMSISLYLGGDVTEIASEDSGDSSATLNSQDDADNQTLFLFRFHISRCFPNQRVRHVLERDVNAETYQMVREILEDNGVSQELVGPAVTVADPMVDMGDYLSD